MAICNSWGNAIHYVSNFDEFMVDNDLLDDPTTNPDLPYDYSDTPVEVVLEECLSLVKQMEKMKPKLYQAALKGDDDAVDDLTYRLHRKYKYYERNIAGIKDRVKKVDNFKTQINNIIRGIC